MLINLTKDIGCVIRDTRKSKGWNQTQLANKIGVTQRKISVLENNPGKINFEIIIQICAVLELKLSINSGLEQNADNNTDTNTSPLDW